MMMEELEETIKGPIGASRQDLRDTELQNAELPSGRP